MRTTSTACARTKALLVKLDAAHARNDVAAAQQALDALYARFDAAAAMSNTLDGATA